MIIEREALDLFPELAKTIINHENALTRNTSFYIYLDPIKPEYDLDHSNYYYFYDLSKWLNVTLITLITLFGIYGNLMSIGIFTSKAYKNIKPLKYYLTLLSLSDLLVLLLHYVDFTFRSWVNLLGAYSSRFNFVDKCSICCKLIPYFRNIFRTISVYVLLLMTLQRFILLYFPMVRSKLNSINFNKKMLIILISLSLILNSNNLFINSLIRHEENGEYYCDINPNYVELHFIGEILFVLFTIFVPTILIFVFSIILLKKINKSAPGNFYFFDTCRSISEKKSRRYSENYLNDSSKFQETLFENSTKKSSISVTINPRISINQVFLPREFSNTLQMDAAKKKQIRVCYQNRKYSYISYCNKIEKNKVKSLNSKENKKKGNSIRTTYMLVLLSKWFIFLHVPYLICWILFHLHMNKSLFGVENRPQNFTNHLEHEIQSDDREKMIFLKSLVNIFEILFLFNYSINFLLYILNGPLFRKRYKKLAWTYLRHIKNFFPIF